ncbi:MAG: MaoC/PaaZ C-terminal domain-containing protein [Xanthomonadales bacterium]|nr:MaoC/PaaZ C-terminal domain-containing protein [Xanthomonadales bacterium]
MNATDLKSSFVVGQDLGVTPWQVIEQGAMTEFETLTLSNDPLHTDPEWVRQHTTYPNTIVPGLLTLSLLPYFFSQLDVTPAGHHALNYGFDRVRWTSPVPVGSHLRAHFVCGDARERSRHRPGVIVRFDVTVQIRGQETPAMVAQWLGAIVPDSTGAG